MSREEQTKVTWNAKDEMELVHALRDEERAKGVIDWNAVASATQSKVSLSKDLITAANCKLKFREIMECYYKDRRFSAGFTKPTLTNLNTFLMCSDIKPSYSERVQLIRSKLKELRSNNDSKEEEEVILLDGIEHVVLKNDQRLQFETRTEALRKKHSRLFLLLAHHKDLMLRADPKANNASSPPAPRRVVKQIPCLIERPILQNWKMSGKGKKRQ